MESAPELCSLKKKLIHPLGLCLNISKSGHLYPEVNSYYAFACTHNAPIFLWWWRSHRHREASSLPGKPGHQPKGSRVDTWLTRFVFCRVLTGFWHSKKPLKWSRGRQYWTMYCLQWLLPLLLIPRPANLFLLHNHSMFMTLYLASFFLERRPCTICTIVFIAAVILICYSGIGNCLFLLECST